MVALPHPHISHASTNLCVSCVYCVYDAQWLPCHTRISHASTFSVSVEYNVCMKPHDCPAASILVMRLQISRCNMCIPPHDVCCSVCCSRCSRCSALQCVLQYVYNASWCVLQCVYTFSWCALQSLQCVAVCVAVCVWCPMIALPHTLLMRLRISSCNLCKTPHSVCCSVCMIPHDLCCSALQCVLQCVYDASWHVL